MRVESAISNLDKVLHGPRSAAGRAGPARPREALEATGPRDTVEISARAKALQAAGELSAEQKAQIQDLRATDAEVRAHENAHASAGGAAAGAPSYEYQKGPDGRLYAVGGEVPIQIQPGGTPEETLANAAQVRAAALAPANPSSADLAVAAAATSMEMQARNELAAQRLAESTEGAEGAAAASVGESVGSREADVSEAAVGEGGSFDARVRDYSQPPAPAVLSPLVDLFG